MPTRLILLGSTGSIGVSTLEVVAHLNQLGRSVAVVGLAANGAWEKVFLQTQLFGVKRVALADPAAAAQLRQAAPHLEVFDGPGAATQLVEACHAQDGATDVAAAIVGFSGLRPTLRAAQLGLRIHLSNKETLVAAGALVMGTAQQSGAVILPVDSEHAAAFQGIACRLPAPFAKGAVDAQVAKLVLTASGGALRDMPLADMKNATAKEALCHPTWKMGQKVTIDSATMLNKALEVIEAHWLFGLPGEKIGALLHPQSIVHALVSFNDGATLAQLASPDMRVPIQAALTWPEAAPAPGPVLDPLTLTGLEFAPLCLERYPGFALAHRAISTGGTSGALLNAANEGAVEAFLAGRIKLGRIAQIVAEVMDAVPAAPADSLEAVAAADAKAREAAGQRV